MTRLGRVFLMAGLLAISWGTGVLLAQAPAAAPMPSADVQAFIGAWDLAIDADGQIFNLDLVIRDADGNAAGEISSEFGSSQVTRFHRDAEKLVLGYSADMNGESFPVVITLNPTAEGADLQLDFGAGTFVANGKGTKK